MGIFGVRRASSSHGSLPDVSAAPRRYRAAFIGAAQRSLAALNQSRLQGHPVERQKLTQRAQMADKFWRFLESELSNRRLGSMRHVQADLRLRTAAQEAHDWFARQCGIRPSTVACVAWTAQLNREREAAYALEHPGEPSWKWRTNGPMYFTAVADPAAGGPCADGVLEALDASFRLTISGESSGTTFTADSVREVRAEADGYRLEVGPPSPYSSVLLLAVNGNAALDAALRRAGLRG